MLYTYAGPLSERKAPDELPVPSDADFTEFFSLLGQAFAAWAQVEQRLQIIYVQALNSPTWARGAVTFMIPTSFNTRLQLVDAMVHSHRPSADKRQRWNKIKKRCGEKAGVRNRLAHGQVLFMLPEAELVISASVGDERRDPIDKPMKARHLRDARDSFIQLQQDILSLHANHLGELFAAG